MKQYTITVNREQLELLSTACDTAGRIYKGLMNAFIFDEFLLKRKDGNDDYEELHSHLRAIEKILQKGILIKEHNTLYDMHQVFRHQMWKENDHRSMSVVSSSVTQRSKNPLPKIEKL